MEHEENRGAAVPHPEHIEPQGFSEFFYRAVELWNIKKQPIYRFACV
uniref:Uncharacterized protein n=1 Tax=Siphoviridae sp. ctP6113 TaxID=2826318 RepID=A0A8S5MUE6_9CAUD|nr:MAG TPA: hypothetical protein [Siphoviridae sp. ctP6113]